MIDRITAAALLTWASATDRRNVTEETATAWAEQLDDEVTLEDGREAINRHYGAHAPMERWLAPADINRLCAEIRLERARRVRAQTAAVGDACWTHGADHCQSDYCNPVEPWECLWGTPGCRPPGFGTPGLRCARCHRRRRVTQRRTRADYYQTVMDAGEYRASLARWGAAAYAPDLPDIWHSPDSLEAERQLAEADFGAGTTLKESSVLRRRAAGHTLTPTEGAVLSDWDSRQGVAA